MSQNIRSLNKNLVDWKFLFQNWKQTCSNSIKRDMMQWKYKRKCVSSNWISKSKCIQSSKLRRGRTNIIHKTAEKSNHKEDYKPSFTNFIGKNVESGRKIDINCVLQITKSWKRWNLRLSPKTHAESVRSQTNCEHKLRTQVYLFAYTWKLFYFFCNPY